MYLELLGGQQAPTSLPESVAMALVIIDTGCGKSMGNHKDQFHAGSMYHQSSSIAGASGTFTTDKCGELRLPVQTDANGIRAYRETGAIYNPSCAYVLLSIGRASIESGVKLEMPSWGEPGKFVYPNGVSVTVHNRNVLVLRPIGYKDSPAHSLAAIGGGELGVPDRGCYCIYIGSGPYRPTDLGNQVKAIDGFVHVMMIDTRIGGQVHDVTRRPVAAALVLAASSTRCVGVVVSIRCQTWSVALNNTDSGEHGRGPYRDKAHVLGIPDATGNLPPVVVEANLETEHATEVCMATIKHGGFVLAEQPARRRAGTTASPELAIPGCEDCIICSTTPHGNKSRESEEGQK